ncbi:MAG: hypothetical protein F6K65_13685 [Moorea sp. SIO3C2]|nr:hypothetical protein [Moorena sp. SIO3C2]
MPFEQVVRYGTDCPNTGYQEHQGYPVPNAPYELLLLILPIPDSRFPIPDSRFPIPNSRLPITDSRFLL